jgi:hypothetical protein
MPAIAAGSTKSLEITLTCWAYKNFLCGRIDTLVRQEKAICCGLENRSKVLLPLLFANQIAVGDEITLPIPPGNAAGAEIMLMKGPLQARGGVFTSSRSNMPPSRNWTNVTRVLFPRRCGVAVWASRPSFYPVKLFASISMA